MSAEPDLQADISVRRFPGEEEPTSRAAWISLATVLVFLAAVLVYSLHIAAPDPYQEYTDYKAKHPMRGAADHLEAARFCAALGAKLEPWRDAHLRDAFQLDPAAPGLEDELLRRYREKAARAATAPAHVSLAEWCRSFHLKRAALAEYRAALATDPENAAAKQGLEDLRK